MPGTAASSGASPDARVLGNQPTFYGPVWKRYHPFGNGVLASQRARIAEKLHLLGVPEERVKTGFMRLVP